MRATQLPAVFFLLVLPVAGQEGPEKPDGDRILEDVRFLASDSLRGRLSGTEDEKIAGHYIARTFEEAGLVPAGDAGGWFQSFERRIYEGPGPGNRLEIVRGGKRAAFELGEDFQVLALSSKGEVEAGLAFAGYGISAPDKGYDDYAGLDVAGKAVLVLRGTPSDRSNEGPFAGHDGLAYASLRRKVEAAKERGVAAVLVANDPHAHSGEADRLLAPALSGDVPGPILPAVHVTGGFAEILFSSAGRSLAETQKKIDEGTSPDSFVFDGLSVSLATDVRWKERTLSNVLGLVEGTDPALAGETIVVGAHYDHLGLGYVGSLEAAPGAVHNGADDNASGTAVMMELARLFARSSPRLSRPRRSILFAAFTGEELGLFGSGFYAEHPVRPLDSTIAMANLDMVGRFDGKSLQISGVGTAEEFEALVDGLGRDFRIEIAKGESGYGPSDHTSFYARKVPVLFFFTGSHSDYHKASDDADRLDARRLGEVAGIVEEAVRRLDSAQNRPTYRETAPPPAASGRGVRVRFGVLPDYSAGDVGGLRITGVSAGGPAARAGLLAGDVIVRFGRFKIGSIYDYTEALGSFGPGDEVEVEVRRGSEEKTFRATLEGAGR
ncbi:MAG: M28 family peptidase [Planctomycetes bacterium]|nr:M28 family peptidase [Planctomycetota bacterium]